MSRSTHYHAEQRSLALHAEVARRIQQDPMVLHRARQRVQGWSEEGGVARYWVEIWVRILSGTVEEIVAAITDPSEEGRALRQTSPFAGAIDPRTRWAILRRVRAELEAP